MLKNKSKIICKYCKKEFWTYNYRLKSGRGKFCSIVCHNLFQKGKLPWNTGIKSKKLSDSKKGSNNPMWRGGVTKKEGDKKYRLSPKGIISHRKSIKKFYEKEENKQKKRDWMRDRRKTNIHYKLKKNISNGIWVKLVRYRGFKKDRKVAECLPYTINELKEHLEKLFKDGINWDNYGKWHIDHKIPDSSFTYSSTKDEEFQKSWALSNLQPMWGVENIRKGNKII